MSSVLQPWVHDLTIMQQTVLLTAVRGPDNTPKYGPTKYLLRWYRRCILMSSLDHCVIDNPWEGMKGGSFMGQSIVAHFYAGDNTANAMPFGFSEVGALETRPIPGPSFGTWQEAMDDVVSAYLREVDAIPHHFQLHCMHAAEIVGYKHPGVIHDTGRRDDNGFPVEGHDGSVRLWWNAVYNRLVNDMHLHPETEAELDRRLGDNREQWLERADIATVK